MLVMAWESDFIDKYIQIKERLYLLNASKSTVVNDIDNITLRHFGLNPAAKGEIIETARWLNQYLESKGMVKELGDGLEVELYKALNREKIAGPYQMSLLKSDFYQRLRTYLRKGDADGEFQKAKVYARDLITLRLNKLTALAVSTSENEKVLTMLTPEESMVFEQIRKIVKSWKRTLLGEY
jgi:archaellum biogenesis protein FlaJ (TadC family)